MVVLLCFFLNVFFCFSWLLASVAFGFGGFRGFCGFWLSWLSWLPWLLAFVASVAFVAFGFQSFAEKKPSKQASKQALAAHLWIWCAAAGGRCAPPPPQPPPRHEICTSSPTPAPATKSTF